MNIHTESRGNILVMHVIGRIDSATAPALEQALTAALNGGSNRLVINIPGVDYISSAGLRVLLVAGKRIRTLPDGKLVLCSLREQIREVFEISGFLAIFSIASNLDAAVKLFN